MQLASYIEHTNLNAFATRADITQLTAGARMHSFKAVCVPPHYVPQARQELAGTSVQVATVAGFPMGYDAVSAKLATINTALAQGADEIDMVVNLAALKNIDEAYLSREIALCLQPVRLHRKVLKVIVESGNLTEQELRFCCNLYARHKVDYLKTSTGMLGTGATLAAVQLMRSLLPDSIGIKASGGIRTFAFASELIAAGATRIGTSAGPGLLKVP
jgi:deoxyribose-phosphate aldolase